MEERRLDDLNLDGLKLYQYKNGYTFTSDSVLLANFVNAKKSDTCVEIGAGSGVISILVNHKTKPKQIFAFEFQQKYADLMQQNLEYNNITNIQVIADKVQNFNKYLTNQVDVVFCNPPYYDCGDIVSKNDEVMIAKHQKFLPLDELILCAQKMLKFGGKFYVVYPANRVSELIFELKKQKLEPKKMFFAQPTESKNANTVFVECAKGGKAGVVVLPTLITNNLDGEYVQTIQKLYRDKGNK